MKLILVLILLFSLCGCSQQAETADIFAMDTIISLKLYGNGSKKGISEMKNEIQRIDKKFSPGAKFSVDYEIQHLIDTANDVSNATNKSFDIYMGEVMALWGFYDKNYTIPSEIEIKDALKKEKYDFGGIAKGYAGDLLKDIAIKNNVKSAILTLGGNVVAIGKKPNGDPWKVGIANPENPTDYIGFVEVSDKNVITSGGYQRFFEQNGKIYHHIINPKTGYPAESDLSSVTIISKNGILADALSTACFVLGKEKTLELYNSKTYDFEAVLIENNGNIITTDNANFTGKE